MKHTLLLIITFVYLVLPYLIPFTAFATKVQVCERVEGCPTFNNASTLEEYCPTCVIKVLKQKTAPKITYVTNVTVVKKQPDRPLYDRPIFSRDPSIDELLYRSYKQRKYINKLAEKYLIR